MYNAWKVSNVYSILAGKPEGKRPFGRPRRRWEDNIITAVREIGWEGVEWMHLAYDRDQWRAVLNTIK
jgi:hypothetical protein